MSEDLKRQKRIEKNKQFKVSKYNLIIIQQAKKKEKNKENADKRKISEDEEEILKKSKGTNY